MSAANVNVVVVTGNLTRDPELRFTHGGTPLCELRVAVNSRRKDGQSGQWGDKPNYFDVTVWGARGEAAAKHLAKGSPVAVEGRLDWREWETEGGDKRESVEIVAEQVQFLSSSKPSQEAPASEEEPEAEESPEVEEQLGLDEEAEAQAESDEQSELASLTREQLDSRARDLGIENPERLQNKAAAIIEIEAAQAAYEFAEAESGEEELTF
jgi:single stranded DNA-binding protein (ssb)